MVLHSVTLYVVIGTLAGVVLGAVGGVLCVCHGIKRGASLVQKIQEREPIEEEHFPEIDQMTVE